LLNKERKVTHQAEIAPCYPDHMATPMPVPRYLRALELAHMLGVSRATIRRWERLGHLPRGVRLSPGVVAWRTDVIEAWVRARATPPAPDRA
jgi:predicted DNA-binding transcriptional regulator AlpA